MERALSASARIIGVNNRNLHTFEVDLAVTERLAARKGENTIFVGESGIATKNDVQRMADANANAVLVGTHFMKQPEPGAALVQFKKEIAACYA